MHTHRPLEEEPSRKKAKPAQGLRQAPGGTARRPVCLELIDLEGEGRKKPEGWLRVS